MTNNQLFMQSILSSDVVSSSDSSSTPVRNWLARLNLQFVSRPAKTVMQHVEHLGPLRVQRPFYPEQSGVCHVYLLHPPGGMVVGDELTFEAQLAKGSQVLITTPSAGKLYGAKHLTERQRQTIMFQVGADACVEWLPQETIVFNGAQGELSTRVDVDASGKFFVWDIVRLGRAASNEPFIQGSCRQSLEVWRNDKPIFIERNVFQAGSPLMQAKWGLQNTNTSATLCASLSASRDDIDIWLEYLQRECGSGLWGLTQKQQHTATPLFIARYLGDSILDCRRGFEYLWRKSRPLLNNLSAVEPRIWRT